MRFKDETIEARFKDMHSLAQTIALDADEWSQKKYDIELTITATTSTTEEDRLLGRVSDTHRTRRAFDIRTRNLPEAFIAELISYLTKKYGKYGAVSSALPKLVVSKIHGTGPHLHIQLSRKYASKELPYDKI